MYLVLAAAMASVTQSPAIRSRLIQPSEVQLTPTATLCIHPGRSRLAFASSSSRPEISNKNQRGSFGCRIFLCTNQRAISHSILFYLRLTIELQSQSVSLDTRHFFCHIHLAFKKLAAS